MAGLITTPLVPVNLSQGQLTGQFFSAPPTGGIDAAGAGNAFATAWGSNNTVLIPNTSGNTILWYYCGAVAAGITQVLVGQAWASQVLPASTAQTIVASSSGWVGPFSPATYNIGNLALVPAGIAGTPTIASWPNAALGCYCVAFTTTTNLSIRAYTFANILP